MILFRKANDITAFLATAGENGKTTGFVPTMGALHNGHISLVRACKERSDIVIVSIFVNPTQFNDPADFQKYPVTIEKDIYLLETSCCDVLFIPSVEEIYPTGNKESRHYDFGSLTSVLEGKFRPGHFQGVCQVMERLLKIVLPNYLFLGQKDYQQCLVIQSLVHSLKLKTSVVICPTQREADGLAMSSRNMRLNKDERKIAPVIFQTLTAIKENLNQDNLIEIKDKAIHSITYAGLKVDYVEICNATTLEPVSKWDGKTKLVVAIAAFLNEVRLIDNILIPGDE